MRCRLVLLTIHSPSRLELRNLSVNKLTGPIPSTIGELTALRILYVVLIFLCRRAHIACRQLFVNELTGQIPTTIGRLTRLSSWYDNFFTISLSNVNSQTHERIFSRLHSSGLQELDTNLQAPLSETNCLVRLDSCNFDSLKLTRNRIARRIRSPFASVRRGLAPR